MRIIISGGGRVGSGIAERLAAEKNDVSVIDTSPELIQNLRDTVDVRGFVGHGADPEVLENAGAEEADMIIAVTLSDEVNMVACQVAHSLFDVPTKIARIRQQSYLQRHYSDLFSRDNMPIDVIISPEIEVGEMVLRRIALPGAQDVVQFADGEVSMIAIECKDDCPIINTPLGQLSDLFPDLPSTVVGVVRDDKLFVPHSRDQLLAGDLGYVVTRTDQVIRTLGLFGHEEVPAQRIVIGGGGNIGNYVAKAIEERQTRARAKIIENDINIAERIAEGLNRTVVLHGSVLENKLLMEADIHEADLLVSLTNSDQINILSSVVATRLGCKSTLALINDPSLHDFVGDMGIDNFINPRALTISRILQHVRRGRIRSVHSVLKGDAEIIEADALDTSPLVGAPLRDLELPRGTRIGAIYRDGKVIRPDGDLRIKPKDRIIMLSLISSIRQAEQLFRVSLDYF